MKNNIIIVVIIHPSIHIHTTGGAFPPYGEGDEDEKA